MPVELCSNKLVKLDLAYNLLESLPSAIGRLSALVDLSLEGNLLTSLLVLGNDGAADPEQRAADERGGLASLRVLNVRHNRITTSAGLGDFSGLKSLVEVRFSPQDVLEGQVEQGLAEAVESISKDDGRTLREHQLNRLEPPDEDVDDDAISDILPAYLTEDETDLMGAAEDPLKPPISAIIEQAAPKPSLPQSQRPHPKQQEVGGRVFKMIEKSLLDQLRSGGAQVESLGDAFDDFELVVAVPELNSLFNQTTERLEGFARYYLSTRGQRLWTHANEGELLPHGAVFKVRWCAAHCHTVQGCIPHHHQRGLPRNEQAGAPLTSPLRILPCPPVDRE